MAIKEEMKAGVSILEIKGKLMGGPETTEIHSRVKELVANGVKKVVIDLGKVSWMNSTGLGALMSSLTTMRNAQGDLKIARATDKVKSLFMVTKLITIFDSHDTVEDALQAFAE
ncbi:STAS domain-containing protein [candidate division KSB1 bacterium]|nr:STAS domain-containing protein [candidate division KSB1 bacterium]RQW08688.1 MAG: anti-sigma factor antagonist [candidate division KSB1 bacterium]